MRFIKVKPWFDFPETAVKQRISWICADHIRIIEETSEGRRPHCFLWGLFRDEAVSVDHAAEEILNMISVAENR